MLKEVVRSGDKAAAAAVFEAVFGWGAYVKRLLEVIPDEGIITVEENGTPAGCALVITVNGAYGKGGYLYGVGVLREYRLRGYMRLLMSKAEAACGELGCNFIYLVPQEEYLFPIYERFGYTGQAYKNTYAPRTRCGKRALPADLDEAYGRYAASAADFAVLPKEVFALYLPDAEFYLTEKGCRVYRDGELFESFNSGDEPTGRVRLGLYKPCRAMPTDLTVNGVYLD